MPPRTRRGLRPDSGVLAAVLGAIIVTGVLLGPVLRPGYGLYLDHVAVPEPHRPTWTELSSPSGLRAWPLSGVEWAWSQVLPAWSLQHAVLLLAVAGSSLGAGLVLRRWGPTAAFSAAVLAGSNPYLLERLLLGQTPLLLAYSSLPWVIIGSRQATMPRRLGAVTLATVPASLTPWGTVIAAVAALTAAMVRRRRPREVLAQTLLSGVLFLPWLIPVLLHPQGPADPDGAQAFRLASELPVGSFGSALVGGGVWSQAARVLTGDIVATTGAVALLALACAGAVVVWRRSRWISAALTLVALSVPGVASLLSGPALQWWADRQDEAGVALFRDLHRILAPSVIALTILAALGVQLVVEQTTRGMPILVVVLAIVLPLSIAVMVAPNAPSRIHTAYRTVSFPSEWADALQAVGADRQALSIPWQPLRRATWTDTTFLDPSPKALGSQVISDTRLTVARDGQLISVDDPPGEDERHRMEMLRPYLTDQGAHPLPLQLLASNGVTRILVWKNTPGHVPALPDSWTVTFAGTHFDVWASPDPADR